MRILKSPLPSTLRSSQFAKISDVEMSRFVHLNTTVRKNVSEDWRGNNIRPFFLGSERNTIDAAQQSDWVRAFNEVACGCGFVESIISLCITFAMPTFLFGHENIGVSMD